jgi:hypothetical protein
LPLADFSGLAFMGILRTRSSPMIFAEKAMDLVLGFDAGMWEPARTVSGGLRLRRYFMCGEHEMRCVS